jgi:hypothetical protein
MPIFGCSLTDEQLFSNLNFVIVGYLMLFFIPHYKATYYLTLLIVFMYSVEYLLLLVTYLATNTDLSIDFATLDGVVKLFSDSRIVFAGWTHYIAFDLFVARYIVFDAMRRNISHLLVMPIIPVTLMAGPAGFLLYQALQVAHGLMIGKKKIE